MIIRMKKEILPELESEPLAVQTLYPDPEYFQGWSEAQRQKEEEIESIFEGENPDVVGITHTDADGYGCEVMLREAYPEKDVLVVTAAENGPTAVQHIGETVTENLDHSVPIFIMDLAPNAGDGRKFIDPFRQMDSVTVIDHHEWEDGDRNQIEWEAEVYHDTERCATQIVHDELIETPRSEITELSNVTADHDLWIKERRDESDALSDLAYYAERDEYVTLAQEYGHKMLETDRGINLVKEAQEIRQQKTKLAVDRTTFHTVNDQTVAIAYGECNGSAVGEELYENHDADLACIVYPNGNVSFRTPEDNPVARDMAIKIGGGGHKCAAGGKLNLVGKSVNYTTFWATKGRAARDHLTEIASDVL
jgi:oligoribonuclease NrnB/cAMP/cGMP phosphodiesterase (DHH superfamily)